jgi:Flp pilus assembly pilin Flp
MKTSDFWSEQDGQDMVEYVLILGAVSLAGAAAMIAMSGDINILWSVVNSRLTSASN